MVLPPMFFVQVSKLHHDLEEAIHTNTQLLADSSARQVELKSKDEELAGLRVEMLKVIKVNLTCSGWDCTLYAHEHAPCQGQAGTGVQGKLLLVALSDCQ
jgi:hypothetical protein